MGLDRKLAFRLSHPRVDNSWASCSSSLWCSYFTSGALMFSLVLFCFKLSEITVVRSICKVLKYGITSRLSGNSSVRMRSPSFLPLFVFSYHWPQILPPREGEPLGLRYSWPQWGLTHVLPGKWGAAWWVGDGEVMGHSEATAQLHWPRPLPLWVPTAPAASFTQWIDL